MSYGPNATDGGDWESSFSQILNRTKHNLNRINQRYAPPTASSVDSAVLQPRGQFNNENTFNQQSLLLDRFSNTSNTYLQQRLPEPQSKPVLAVDTSVLERLNRLEEQLRASENASSHRLSNLDMSIESAMKGYSRSNQQVQDLEHTVTQLQNKITTLNGFVEVLQSENDSKRTVISKMDHWIRQGEIWREDLDGKVESLSKLAKSLDRTRNEQRELMAEHVTRYELEQLRDKMTVVTQQSVAASLSAWHDKMEQSVRNVERQIALLRIGMTDPDRSTGVLLTQDEVMAALATPLPSELLLKGTVANEVLQMENKLEDKLENRLQLFLKDRIEGTHNNLYKHLHQQLHNLCAEMGIDYPDVVPGAGSSSTFDPDATAAFRFDPEAEEASARSRQNYRIRLLEARKKSDDEIQELNRTVDRLSSELHTLQQSSVLDIKQHAAQVVNLERKVEECITVSANSVTSVADRSARLEDVVRETELSIRATVNDTKAEFLERLSDLSRDWTTERAGLDRRLLVNERIAEDCLDRIKLSQSAVESYFKASPEVKKFQRSAELVAQLQAQVNDVQAEVRSTSAVVHKLEANSANKNEHLELRERVGRMEPTVLEKFPDYFESTKRVVDLSLTLQSKVDKLDVQATHQHNDLQSTMSKLSAVDVLATQLKGTTTVATEEIRRLTASVAEIDSTTRKDVNYLRDLAGSLSSRVVAVEGKVTLMNKTYAADSITTNNALARLSTSCEALEAHDVTAQNTLVQLQWALETEHKENVDNFATLKARLDLLQHVQEQHSARGPGPDYGDANKSIEIKFTTDESGEMDDEREGYVTTTYSNHNSPRRTASHKSPHQPSQHTGSPQVTKATHRGGSAFLTESEPSVSAPSSPDKSHSFLQAYEVFKKAEESRLNSAQNSPVRTGGESPQKPTRRSFDFDQQSMHSDKPTSASTNVSANVSANVSTRLDTSSSLDSGSKAGPSTNTTVNTSIDSSVNKVANTSVSAKTPAHNTSVNTTARSVPELAATNNLSNASNVSVATPAAPVALQEDEESELSFEREERLQASFAQNSPPLSSAEQSPSSLRRSNDREESPQPVQSRQQDHSWDDSRLSQTGQDIRNESSRHDESLSGDVSSSRIPMHSAFDMSMPSYVSHIDSSGDANQSSFDYPFTAGGSNSDHGSAAASGSDHGSNSGSPAGKLSIGSEDSLENLNTTVEEFRRHKEALLETTRSAQKLSVNNSHNTSFASPASPTSPPAPSKQDDTSQSMQYVEESDSEDEHSEPDRRQPDATHFDQDSDLEDDEFDQDSSSGPGDFSQIDMPVVSETSGAPPTAPVNAAAVSMVNNSWDASTMQGSPAPTNRSASNQSAVNVSTASNLSASTASSTASSAAGRAKIPSLNIASLPPSSPNLEPPSDRSLNRNQPDRTGVSDWDAESSFASDSTGATPPRPLNSSRQGVVSKTAVPPIALTAAASASNKNDLAEMPSFDRSSSGSEINASASQSPTRLNLSTVSSTSQARISALDMSSIDRSPPRSLNLSQVDTSQSRIIGASDASPAPKQRQPFDDSTISGTAGSVSDSSASTSDYSASSHSYLTVGSISPQKASAPPVVPAAATAKPTAVVAAEAVASTAPASTPVSLASSVSADKGAGMSAAPVAGPTATAPDASVEMNSSKMSIKDRLKQRQELLKLQKKAADSANVSSAASVASSADNAVMSFEAFDDSQG